MALTLLQTKTGVDTTFASSVASTAFANPLTNGSIILVAWEGDAATAANSANTPTDTAGNTYVRVISKLVTATFDLEIWYALNTHTTASNVVTITDTIGGSDGIIIVEEWSGNVSSSPTDGSSSNSGTTSPLTAGNIATTHSNDLIWVAGVEAVAANDLTAASGYSNLTQTSTAFSNLGICSQVGAAGSYNGGFTSSVGVSWACAAVAIKDTAAGLTVVPVSNLSLLGVG